MGQVLAPFLPVPVPAEVSDLLHRVAAAAGAMDAIAAEAEEKADESLDLNAAKRQLNAEIARIESRLLELDQNRLTLCNAVNDAQSDWSLLSNKSKDVGRRIAAAQTRAAEAAKRHEQCISDLSSLQSDAEAEKDTHRKLSEELTALQNLHKNYPALQRSIAQKVEKHTGMLHNYEASLADVRKLKARFEHELELVEEKEREDRAARGETPDLPPSLPSSAPSSRKSSRADSNASDSSAPPAAVSAASASASASDAGAVAGPSSSIGASTTTGAVTPSSSRSRSRSGSLSSALPPTESGSASASVASVPSDMVGHAAATVKSLASSASSVLGSVAQNLQSMLPPVIAHPIEAIEAVTGTGSSSSSSSSASAPPALATVPSPASSSSTAAPSVDSPSLGSLNSPSLIGDYRGMKLRIRAKLSDLSRQESVHEEQLAVVRDILAQLRAQAEREENKMRDPDAVAERITALRAEVDRSRNSLATLNTQQSALNRTLQNLDAERRSVANELRDLERMQAHLNARLTTLDESVQAGEEKLRQLGVDKENLSDQMRLKLSTQAIVAEQQQEGVMRTLSKLHDRFESALNDHRRLSSQLVSLLDSLLRSREWSARREKMKSLGIELSEREGEGPKIQAPELMDDTGHVRMISDVEDNKYVDEAHKLTQQLAALFQPCKTNYLLSPLLAYRQTPYPWATYVSVEGVAHDSTLGSPFSPAASPSSSSSSTSGSSARGLLHVSHALLLFDSDVHLGGSLRDDSGSPFSPSSFSRFCIDLSRGDLLSIELRQAPADKKTELRDDDAPSAETKKPSTSTSASSASAPAPSAPKAPSSPLSLPASDLSLLLFFRPGYRNRFLFNVDATYGIGGGGGSGGLGGSTPGAGSASPSVPSTLFSLAAAAAGAGGSNNGGSGGQREATPHVVRISASSIALRQMYRVLRLYLSKASEQVPPSPAPSALRNEAGGDKRSGGVNAGARSPAAGASPASGSRSSAASRSSGASAASPSTPTTQTSVSKASSSLYQQDTSVFVEGASELLHPDQLRALIKAAPSRYSLQVWGMVYSMSLHGVSRSRFFDIMSNLPCALVVIRDMRRSVFGGFASVPFSPSQRQNYYGSGECFVFRVHAGQAQIFRWRGADDYFMITGESYIAMGGGSAYAWQLDKDFRFGTSGPCSTFESPMLTSQRDFEANDMEVWAPIRDQLDFVVGESSAAILHPSRVASSPSPGF